MKTVWFDAEKLGYKWHTDKGGYVGPAIEVDIKIIKKIHNIIGFYNYFIKDLSTDDKHYIICFKKNLLCTIEIQKTKYIQVTNVQELGEYPYKKLKKIIGKL